MMMKVKWIIEKGYERNYIGLNHLKAKSDDFYVMRKFSDKIDRRHLVILAHLLKYRINDRNMPEFDEIAGILIQGSQNCVPKGNMEKPLT